MTQTKSLQILLVDDHAVVREGLMAILNRQPDMTVVAEASDGEQAVTLYRQHQPDITLMDLRMPKLEGANAIAQICADFPAARIIILTTYDGDEDIYRGLQAGAKGYLLKDASTEALLTAIHTVHQGKRYIPPEVAAKLAERIDMTELTQRELDVLKLLVTGLSNQDISQTLSISEGTVKFHVNNILNKFGVRDRTQAVIMALKRGLARL